MPSGMDRNSANCNLPYITSTYVQIVKELPDLPLPRFLALTAWLRQSDCVVRVKSGFESAASGGRAWIRTRDPALIKRML